MHIPMHIPALLFFMSFCGPSPRSKSERYYEQRTFPLQRLEAFAPCHIIVCYAEGKTPQRLRQSKEATLQVDEECCQAHHRLHPDPLPHCSQSLAHTYNLACEKIDYLST
jgi:hypothetical protein